MPKSLNEAALEIISPILDDRERHGGRLGRPAGSAMIANLGIDAPAVGRPPMRTTPSRWRSSCNCK